MMRFKSRRAGYTLIELMIVVAIVAILTSILMPQFDLVFRKANQAKTRSNLGSLRTAISLYYTENDGQYPLPKAPPGNSHYANYGDSLTRTLSPRWINKIAAPKVVDRTTEFNGMGLVFDRAAEDLMTKDPPNDVFIILGAPDYTPFLVSPFAFDNSAGHVYIPNGNYDYNGTFFYEW